MCTTMSLLGVARSLALLSPRLVHLPKFLKSLTSAAPYVILARDS